MNTRTRRWTGLLAALLTMASTAQPSHAAPEQVQAQARPAWITTWIASPEARWNGDFPLPTNLPHQLWDQTVRQVARVSIGGSRPYRWFVWSGSEGLSTGDLHGYR